MRSRRLLPEEQLLFDAAELPVLSPGLRARVLEAALETQYRQVYGRRALWAAGLLVACLGLTAWHGPLTAVRDDLAEARPAGAFPQADDVRAPCLNVSQRYGSGELLLTAAGDDWRLVEAEAESRRTSFRQIHNRM